MLKIRNRLQELLLQLFSCSASINSNTTLQKYDFKVLLIIRVNDTKFFHKGLCLQLSKNGHKFKVQYDFYDLMDLLVSLNMYSADSLGSR